MKTLLSKCETSSIDNWATSFKQRDEAVNNGQRIIEALKKLSLSSYRSSPHRRLTSLRILKYRSSDSSVDLPLDKDFTERFLGFTWNWVRDIFKLKISKEILTYVRTKRELLKAARLVSTILWAFSPFLLNHFRRRADERLTGIPLLMIGSFLLGTDGHRNYRS